MVIACLVVGFVGASLVFPFGGETVAAASAAPAEGQQLYTCGMHPQIISDKPGVCPICNMKLTPIRDGARKDGAITIDPATRQNMGLVTRPASYRTLIRTINTFGTVKAAEPNVHTVTIKTDGWVERLFVAEEGEQVFAGQPLIEVYSPDLVAAQKELLVALKTISKGGATARLAEMAEERLRNWDISGDQITRLKEAGEITRTMIIRSPADGFVASKKVNAGDRVTAHSILYEITDLSTVWVVAQIYEQDLPFVKVGQNGQVTIPSLPGERFDARLTWLSPILDNRGQAEVRFELNNSDSRLRPEMYAEITISSSQDGKRLTVPRAAIINSGTRKLVFVATSDNSFEPRAVTTGPVGDGDMVAIVDGLREGEEVVTSGQFLLDSESRLKEVLADGGMSPHMGHGAMDHDMPDQDMTDHGTMNHDMSDNTTTDHGAMSSGSMDREMSTGDEMKTPSVGQDDDPWDVYTCPMPSHYHVLNYGPGQCPECGMDLVPLSETDNGPVYVCPMPRGGPPMKEPGNCSHCGMELIEYKPGAHHDR